MCRKRRLAHIGFSKPTTHCFFFFGDADGERAHTGDDLDLGNTVGVTEDDTDLGRGGALLGELADLVDDLLGGGLEPRGGVAGVGDGGGGDALALAVKTTHLDVLLRRLVSCRRRGTGSSLGVVGENGGRKKRGRLEISKNQSPKEVRGIHSTPALRCGPNSMLWAEKF